MRSTLLFTVLTATLAVGCSRNINPDDTNGGDDTADTDTGEDTDTDTDTGGDTDTDTGGGDTDTGNDVDCQANYNTPAPDGSGSDACHTGSLQCGDEIYASTAGGSTHYGESHYENYFCWDTREIDWDYTGPERVYTLDIPPATRAKVILDAPCEDLSLRIFNGGECMPDDQTSVSCTRQTPHDQWQEPTFDNPDTGASNEVEVVIDTQFPGDEANFRLEVVCTAL